MGASGSVARMRRGRKRRPGEGARRCDDRGETLALLVVWPALITAILLMLVHAFIVTNAQAEADLAASQGLRSAWHAAADSDFLYEPNPNPPPQVRLYTGSDPHPDVLAMARAAEDTVARAASTEQGWRWWTPGVAEVQSNWCDTTPGNRPGVGETGWVRVVVSGEVFGPLAALWPNRWDRVYAAAEGPALLIPPDQPGGITPPAALPTC